MKKFPIFVLALLTAVGAANAAVSVKLSLGPAFLSLAQYNSALTGTFDYYRAAADSVTGAARSLHWGCGCSGEIIASIGPSLSLGLGAGCLRASRESTLSYASLGFNTEETYRPKFAAIPLSLTLHYSYPLGKSFRLDFFGGGVYYLTTFRHEFLVASNFFSYKQTQDFISRTDAFGLRGGLGLELVLFHGFALVLEAEGRYAVIPEVRGDLTTQESLSGSSAQNTVHNAFLWIYNQSEGGQTYTRMVLSQNQPFGSSAANIRKGQIDLSGISARAGIKFTF